MSRRSAVGLGTSTPVNAMMTQVVSRCNEGVIDPPGEASDNRGQMQPDYAGRDLEGKTVRHAFWAEAWTKENITSGVAATASLLDGLSQSGRTGEGQEMSLPNGAGLLVVHEVLGSYRWAGVSL